jgi:energy-converting hydrogenase Eha subunit E
VAHTAFLFLGNGIDVIGAMRRGIGPDNEDALVRLVNRGLGQGCCG